MKTALVFLLVIGLVACDPAPAGPVDPVLKNALDSLTTISDGLEDVLVIVDKAFKDAGKVFAPLRAVLAISADVIITTKDLLDKVIELLQDAVDKIYAGEDPTTVIAELQKDLQEVLSSVPELIEDIGDLEKYGSQGTAVAQAIVGPIIKQIKNLANQGITIVVDLAENLS